jgi:hypothetical protein
MKRTVSMAAIALATLTSAASAQSLLPTADTFTAQGTSSNFSTSPTINIGGASNYQGLIQFDLANLPTGLTGAGIAKANLVLFVNKIGTAGAVNINAASGAWTETGVTGFNSPVMAMNVANSVPVNTAGSYITVDATTLVKAWIDGTLSNAGIIVSADPAYAGTSIFFDSKENVATSHPAMLQVVLTGGNSGGGTGATGAQGIQGAQGLTGATGPIGPDGAPGVTGAKGATGATGANGATGPIGTTGLQGTAGVAGAAGPAGPAGTTGATGAAGLKGNTGNTGNTGSTGATGVAGPIGPAGPAGGEAGTIFLRKQIGNNVGSVIVYGVPSTGAELSTITFVPSVSGRAELVGRGVCLMIPSGEHNLITIAAATNLHDAFAGGHNGDFGAAEIAINAAGGPAQYVPFDTESVMPLVANTTYTVTLYARQNYAPYQSTCSGSFSVRTF